MWNKDTVKARKTKFFHACPVCPCVVIADAMLVHYHGVCNAWMVTGTIKMIQLLDNLSWDLRKLHNIIICCCSLQSWRVGLTVLACDTDTSS